MWQDLYPFDSHFLSMGKDRLHYLDEWQGEGGRAHQPTLLFVHGNPSWSFHWRRLIEALSSRFRCVAVDHLGCGMSDVPKKPQRLADHTANLLHLVEELDLRNVTLVAQDWGGAIGLGAAVAARERFTRVLLYNTGAFPPWFIPKRIQACRTPILGKLAVVQGNLFLRAALKMALARKSQLDDDVAAGCLAGYYETERRRVIFDFVHDIPLKPSHPTWKTLADLEQKLPNLAELPIKLVWGMQDWCFTPACLEKFSDIWPHAEVSRLDDAGHWVVEDAPEEALRELDAFVSAETGDLDSGIDSAHRAVTDPAS